MCTKLKENKFVAKNAGGKMNIKLLDIISRAKFIGYVVIITNMLHK